jgi:pantetheine-phosphate adenylyltransferase
MSIAVYAGTFDPVTLGHLSVLRQAARIFSHVRMLVAVNPDKRTLFSLEERVSMIRELTSAIPNVSVDGTGGLVVDYAREIGASFLVRGVRGATDAHYETDLAQQNRELAPDGLTVLLPAEPKLSEVSSSELKRRAEQGESLEGLCPAPVIARLSHRLGAEARP